jgi:hypothetical protein
MKEKQQEEKVDLEVQIPNNEEEIITDSFSIELIELLKSQQDLIPKIIY